MIGILGDEKTFLQARRRSQPLQCQLKYRAVGLCDAGKGGQCHALVDRFEELTKAGAIEYPEILLKQRPDLFGRRRWRDHREVGDEAAFQRRVIAIAKIVQSGERLTHMGKRPPVGTDQRFSEIEHDDLDHDISPGHQPRQDEPTRA
jgi:hypothetical protein